MTELELNRCKEFIIAFGGKIDDEFIYVHDGHTSMILNPNSPWKDFLGSCVLDVADAVAEELNLKIKYKG